MPGLALPTAALRPGKGPFSGNNSPAGRPVSPAKATLPGTLLPLTGVVSPGASNCSSPVEKPLISPSINLKALIPDHVDEDIFDRYDFGKDSGLLGAGGYGTVYLAKDRMHPGRIVAVKKAMMMDGDMREDFQQEVGIMKELDHPNICTVYESYDHGRHVYLVMEYCAGGDLFEYILKHNGLPEGEVMTILRQVASALKHAHDKGIAHRDLKPENVCFADTEDIHVKVIDWGLGFYFKRAHMKTSVGTSAYAAPEVQRPVRGPYTSACDIWSLGAMACVMLTGEPPFFGTKCEEDSTGPQATSGSAWESISQEARNWVANLLRWNPNERPSAEAVLNDPWLKMDASTASASSSASQQVLANLHRFSKTSTFLSLCAASVAQQLSRKGLKELQTVFKQLDTNGDGMLQLHEVRSGFEQMFGVGSAPLEEINEMFQRLDIDGSGAIDYTEFLAAGLGNRVNNEVDALWAAFKAFDVQESDGNITQAEIAQVLYEAGAGQMWSREKCDELAKEVVEQFDRDGNGSLDFDEWLLMMKRHEDPDPISPEQWQRRVSL